LALEVFWTRALVFFLDNSTHAFTTILTAFLLGIAIGSLLVAHFIDKRTHLLAWFGSIEVLIAVLAVLAIPILNHSTPVIQRMGSVALDPTLQWRWTGMRFAMTLTVMLAPTVLIGMTFPLVCRIHARSIHRIGTALGNVYSANTVGGVLGSIIAGFVLIPLVGVHRGIIAVAAISAVIGVLLISSEPSLRRGQRVMAATPLGALFLGVAGYYLVGDTMTLTSYTERIESSEVLSYEEGIGATVKVFANDFGEKLLSVNGFPVAGTPLGLHDAQKPLAHLPLLLTRVPSPRVNIIGFGAGGTSWGILQHQVERVDCVELVPAVIGAAGWFPEVNHGVLDEPRFNLIMGDGRNYALVSDAIYDVISIDATSPKMAGNGSLYALEFYELLRNRLSPEGLVVQWIPFHLLSSEEVRMTARTFRTVFPHTTLWLSALRQHALLVGTLDALQIDFLEVSEKLARDPVLEDLRSLNVTDPVDFLSWFVMGEETLAEYVGRGLVNTDNHPYMEFTPAMAYFAADRYRLANLTAMRDHRESVLPLLTNTGRTEAERADVSERLQRRFDAGYYSLSGDILLSMGRQEEAMAEYNTALLIDPEDKNWMNSIWRGRGPPR
jgi:spermidine synthase